jgi:hypothetical protein
MAMGTSCELPNGNAPTPSEHLERERDSLTTADAERHDAPLLGRRAPHRPPAIRYGAWS